MGIAKNVVKWILPACALAGALWVSLVLHKTAVESRPFLATSSPDGTYTVNLTGEKGRPILFTNTVNYHVSKNGRPFLPSMYLHSGDAMDISFELAYPNHRWVNDNILHFYDEQDFNDGKPDVLSVVNRTGQIIRYLKVVSEDQFLIFDLQPGDERKMLNSNPSGDNKWLYVVGEFYGGGRFESGTTLHPAKESGGPFTYYISIKGDGVTFEGPR